MSHDERTPAPVDVPPLHGEPLPLEFANTVFPVRGSLRDGLGTPEQLAWWLGACRDRLATQVPDSALRAVDASDVRCFVMLRDATRRLIDAYVHQRAPEAWDVAQVNRVSAAGSPWPMLHWEEGGRPVSSQIRTAPPVVAVQAEIAHALIGMLAGTTGTEPRACRAPGCVFFFDHARSRREWCSTGCGNRARVARHYARRHGGS
ncbi:CGNR zinc finger domain-containing protein [Streptomyces sudanensis]|uniref:CGNR zinc finger domain-containing protein n=1 Tax=Streptomyces sudanensis TaxID=436397 RepID=UPI0020CDA755|nr:ABATE domain-containing protein [Streptomyces sudanensis]MCP9958942.1 ABATE domain-containing protein [Streptomyces sudanensis]MCQ0000581.1 ABATE domain-containing protein [Streptomyces sudanensis]